MRGSGCNSPGLLGNRVISRVSGTFVMTPTLLRTRLRDGQTPTLVDSSYRGPWPRMTLNAIREHLAELGIGMNLNCHYRNISCHRWLGMDDSHHLCASGEGKD